MADAPGPGAPAAHPVVVAAAVVVAAQGLLYAALARRGWFYQDDLDFTAQAAGRRLDLHYLTDPVNTHLTPGLRATYWFFTHAAPYDHGVTIAVRAALLATATGLFARLLLLLLGRRPVVLVPLGVYAFSLLTLPSYLSLSSGVNLLPAHVGAILLIDAHVRWTLTRRFRHAVVGAAALAVAVLFWEKVAVTLLVLPLLSLLYLHAGPVRRRVVATSRDWPAWLAYALPVGAFFGYYFTRGYPVSADMPTPVTLLRLFAETWGQGILPALAGGPWSWFATGNVYFSLADPHPWQIAVGALGAAAMVAAGVRRCGPRSLLAWTIPLTYVAASVVLVATGRYEAFGGLIARSYHYLSDAAVPVLLGAVLALVPLDLDAVRRRATRPPDRSGAVTGAADEPAPAVSRRTAAAASLLMAAYLVSFGWSAHGFESRWVRNPTRDYLETLVHDIQAAGRVQLYDTPVSARVVTLLSTERRLSQVLAPLHLPVAFDTVTGGEPRTVDDSGHVVPAVLVPSAVSSERPNVFCSHYLAGVGTLDVPVTPRAPLGDHFVRVDYIMQRGGEVAFRLGDGAATSAPLRGGTRTLRAGLNAELLQTAHRGSVDRVTVTSANPDLQLCVTHVEVGYPLPDRTGER